MKKNLTKWKHILISERVKGDMINLVEDKFKSEINVSLNEEGIQKGVETLFANPYFEEMWITRIEYEDKGVEAVFRKCF